MRGTFEGQTIIGWLPLAVMSVSLPRAFKRDRDGGRERDTREKEVFLLIGGIWQNIC